LSATEGALGRRFPPDLSDLYSESDGCELLEGNLNFVPLATKAGTIGLADLSDELRGNGWAVPDELLVFGSDGQGNQLGIWVPANAANDAAAPIVMLGAIFNRAQCTAVFGTDLPRFLRSWTIYYTLLDGAPDASTARALELLGVPLAWRERVPDDRLLAQILRSVDPDLPSFEPDPYVHGLTAEELRSMYGRSDSRRGS
jgi:hypothetical protein